MSQASNTLRALLTLCRPHNAVPPLLAMLLGYAAAGGYTFSEITLLTGLFGILCLNFAATLQNDLADRAIDASAKRATPFLEGRMSAEQLRSAAIGLTALGIGLPLLLGQKSVVIFLLIYALLCWAYNMPPVQASRRPISSIMLLALLFHTLPFALGTYIGAGGDRFVLAVLLVGGFAQRFALSMLKDYKDYEADKKHHKHTFLIAFAAKATKRISQSLAALGYVTILAVLTEVNVPLLAVAALLPLAAYGMVLRQDLGTQQHQFARNNTLFHRALIANNLFDAGVILCFCFW